MTASKRRSQRATSGHPLPNLNHLYYFHVVASEGSLRKACDRLGVTQPTISAQIKSLESTMGVPLFVRESAGMRLSRAGLLMFEHTRTMFRATADLLEEFARLNDSDDRLHLGIVEDFTSIVSVEAISALLTTDSAWTISNDERAVLHQRFLRGELDMLLSDGLLQAWQARRREDSPSRQLRALDARAHGSGGDKRFEPLGTLSLPPLLAVSRFGGNGSASFPENLNRCPVARHELGSALRRQVDDFLRESEVHMPCVVESNAPQVLLQSARAGRAVTFLPPQWVSGPVAQGELVVLGQVPGSAIELHVFAHDHAKDSAQHFFRALQSQSHS